MATLSTLSIASTIRLAKFVGFMIILQSVTPLAAVAQAETLSLAQSLGSSGFLTQKSIASKTEASKSISPNRPEQSSQLYAQTQPTSIDLSNWMGQLSSLIANRPLKQIVMPGTHDSGMYKNMLPADYAKNQNLDFKGQLDKGVRFFDFRAGYFVQGCGSGAFQDPRNGGECWSCPAGFNRTWDAVTASTACSKSWTGPFSTATYIRKWYGTGWQSAVGRATECLNNILGSQDYYLYGHGTNPSYVVDVKVADALTDMKTWLDAHPKEIVILKVTSLDPNLSSFFGKYLPSTMIYNSTSTPVQNLTPSQLYSQGKRVILVGDVGLKTDSVLESVGYKSSTDGIEDANIMVTYLDKELNRVRPSGTSGTADDKMFEFSAVLTPNGEGHTTVPANPQDLAKKFNPTVEDKIKNGTWKGRALNIVTVDYVDISNVADAIVRANWTVP
ncbi:hypothetical protein [Nostoc sp. LEGE 12450]|uniref:hypothetical protein n=1 Tax=Nostoc sp. LEGE 12450 TaxID=1828643 RepID=UPI001880CE47|nr:hypothetical protein [Nostoc sp. LEGE 12450]MBE8990727.1 hypothetical protein [Nostoc sp. LEGE 12450]